MFSIWSVQIIFYVPAFVTYLQSRSIRIMTFVFQEAALFHKTQKAACDKHNESFYPKFKDEMDEYLYIKHRGIVSFLIRFLTMTTAQEKSQIFHRKLVPYRGSGIVFYQQEVLIQFLSPIINLSYYHEVSAYFQ